MTDAPVTVELHVWVPAPPSGKAVPEVPSEPAAAAGGDAAAPGAETDDDDDEDEPYVGEPYEEADAAAVAQSEPAAEPAVSSAAGPTSVAEADAPAFFAASPERLLPYTEQEGGLVIACGKVSAGFVDTLMWLVPELCFSAVGGLLDGDSVTVELFGSDAAVTLRRDGGMIEITADIMEPARFPPHRCCGRWSLPACGGSRSPLLWPNDAEVAESLAYLGRTGEVTRTRLDAALAST